MIYHLICSTLVNTEGTFDSCNFRFLSFVQMHIFARKEKDPRQCYIMAFGWNLMPKMCNWNMALWRSSKFFRIMYCLRGVNRRTAHLCSVLKHSDCWGLQNQFGNLQNGRSFWLSVPKLLSSRIGTRKHYSLTQSHQVRNSLALEKGRPWRTVNGETPPWCPEASIKLQNIGGENSAFFFSSQRH